MQNQVIETENNQNPLVNLGEHGVQGGPGRPKGSLNKFSRLKEDILEVWEEEGGKEKFRSLFKGTSRDFIKALDIIIRLMPKDEPDDQLHDRIIQVMYPQDTNLNQKHGVRIVR